MCLDGAAGYIDYQRGCKYTMDLQELQNYFITMDSIHGIMEPKIGRWHAWPVIKPKLFHRLLRKRWETGQSAPKETKPLTFIERLKNKGNILNIADFLDGFKLLVRENHWRKAPQLLFLSNSSSRSECTAKGKYLNIYMDEIILSDLLKFPVYTIERPVHWGYLEPLATPVHLNEEPIRVARFVIRNTTSVRKKVKPAAKSFLSLLTQFNFPEAPASLYRLIENSLVIFEVERIIYNKLFKHRNIKGFVFIDSDVLTGPIAAAKENAVPAFELQHGMVGSYDVGYQWESVLSTYKADMPIPDYFLVFGNMWESCLTRKGFWNANEIVPVGAARIDRFRKKIKPQTDKRSDDPIQILFTTQMSSRSCFLPFCHKFLESVESLQYKVMMIVKVHMYEKHDIYQYMELEKRFPKSCKVIFDEEDTFSLILKSDISLSYYSTTLLEAVALGVDAVSICEGCSPEGIAGVFGIPQLRNYIHHVESIEALIQFIAGYRKGETAKKPDRELYTPNFIDNITHFINEKTAQPAK